MHRDTRQIIVKGKGGGKKKDIGIGEGRGEDRREERTQTIRIAKLKYRLLYKTSSVRSF